MTSPLTTHVLDMRLGKPAVGVAVSLDRRNETGQWQRLARGITNEDGRIADLVPAGALEPGFYRLTFDAGSYFESQQVEHFYPQIPVEFQISDSGRHYHVPLLLSPFGYSTYRGS